MELPVRAAVYLPHILYSSALHILHLNIIISEMCPHVSKLYIKFCSSLKLFAVLTESAAKPLHVQ